jgi:uncharacterized membrane protein
MTAGTIVSSPVVAQQQRTSRNDLLALGAIVLVGFALRLPGVRVWYWGDEIQTVVIARRSVPDIRSGLARDGAPPLFYYVLHAWMRVFGTGPSSSHSLTIVLGLLTVVAAWWFGRRHGGTWAGLLAAAAIALNPFLVRFSTETRNYALFGLLGVVAIGLLLDLLRLEGRYTHLLLGIVLGSCMLTHAWGVFFTGAIVAAVWLDALLRRDRELALQGAIALVVAGIVFAPWLPTFVEQARHTGAPWNSRYSLLSTFDQMVGYVGNRAVAAIAALAIAVGFAAALGVRKLTVELVLAAAACVATLALAFVYSYVTPIWQERYGIVAVAAGLVVGAVVASRTRVGVAALCVALLAMAAFTVHDVASSPVDAKPDARFRYVAEAVAPDVPDVALSDQGTLATLRYGLGDRAGAQVRYVSPIGQLADPTLFDWRDDLDHLRAADPARVVDDVVGRAAPGTSFLVIQRDDAAPKPFGPPAPGNEWQRRYIRTTDDLIAAAAADPRLTVVRRDDVAGWTLTTYRRI